MGMKIKNYSASDISPSILQEAYALIKSIEINRNKGTAYFVIQEDREKAFNEKPIKGFTVNFEVNRNENPYIAAYREAKKEILVDDLVPTTGEEIKRSVKMPLYGWEDDIVEVNDGNND